MTTPVSVRFRKLAVDDGLERVRRYDPITGEPYWASPTTGEPLPKQVAGVVFDMDAEPLTIALSSKYVGDEPWIELVGQTVVHRPAGPAENPWKGTHTFVHADEIILHLADGDRRYQVTHQPDKYDDETGLPSDDAGDPTTHVDHFYVAELIPEA